MTSRSGAGSLVAAVAVYLLAVAGVHAQTLRAAAWGSYEDVTASDDWSTAGAQLTFGRAQGHAVWASAELVRRFGETDAVERIGGVLHPHPRWWVSLEAGTALRPEFLPKNSWDVDLTTILAIGTSVGLGYRRWNYVVGPVDVVIPHLQLQTREVTWDLRVFLSRNPSQRTDAAVAVRATTAVSPRATAWLLGVAGRESYLVGTAPAAQVRSLQIVTGGAGIRYTAPNNLTVRIEANVTNSQPVLSRRGLAVGVERAF